jgi:His/Glu/Gln/Arg/opine family amino acid ABC transporter permease subunit
VDDMEKFWSDICRQFYSTFIQDERYKLFLLGLENTLLIAFFAVFIGFFIGVFVGIIKSLNKQTGKYKITSKFCNLYLTIIRGTPVVTQLLIMYYVIFVSIRIHEMIIAVMCFGINSGAYMAEIMRSGISSVEIGQTEAGKCLGLRNAVVMQKIVLPQAIKHILPAIGNEFISLIKETSVVGFITVMDLTRAGTLVRSRTNQPFFSLIFVALVYLIITVILSHILKIFENRLRKSDR